MGWGSWLKVLGGIGSVIAAPFTAGTSLAWLPAALGGASMEILWEFVVTFFAYSVPGVSLAFWPLIAMAVAGGLGSFLGNKKKAKTQTTSPTFDPAFAGIRDLLISNATNRLNSPTSLPPGFESGGIANINNIHGLIGQSLQNKLAMRGLSGSPNEASVLARAEQARGGDIAQFSNQIPLLELDYRNRDIDSASRLLGMGMGTSTVGPGSPLGSGLLTASGLLAYLYGKGAFGGGNPAGAPPLGGDGGYG